MWTRASKSAAGCRGHHRCQTILVPADGGFRIERSDRRPFQVTVGGGCRRSARSRISRAERITRDSSTRCRSARVWTSGFDGAADGDWVATSSTECRSRSMRNGQTAGEQDAVRRSAARGAHGSATRRRARVLQRDRAGYAGGTKVLASIRVEVTLLHNADAPSSGQWRSSCQKGGRRSRSRSPSVRTSR